MTALDPRTPVVVGVNQVSYRGDDAPEPVSLLAEAARTAAVDAGRPDVVAAVDSLAVMKILSWRYRDRARLFANRLGIEPRWRVYTPNRDNGSRTWAVTTEPDVLAGMESDEFCGHAVRIRPDARFAPL